MDVNGMFWTEHALLLMCSEKQHSLRLTYKSEKRRSHLTLT